MSINSGGTGSGNAGSFAASIESQSIVFASDASDLVPMDSNLTTDVFVRDHR